MKRFFPLLTWIFAAAACSSGRPSNTSRFVKINGLCYENVSISNCIRKSPDDPKPGNFTNMNGQCLLLAKSSARCN